MYLQIFISTLLLIVCFLLYKIYYAVIDVRTDLIDKISRVAEIGYWKNKAIRNNQGAYGCLLDIIFATLNNPLLSKKQIKVEYEKLKDTYEETFQELGYSFLAFEMYKI